MSLRSIGIIVALGLAGTAVAAPAGQMLAPDALIQDTAERVLAALDGRRDELKQNQTELYALVDEILLPRFDVLYAGRVAMGKYGRDATPEQRRRFIDAFYRSLVRTYADGLLDFTASSLRVLSDRSNVDGDKAKVSTEVVLDDGTVVPVDYRLRRTENGWKAYDVVIEGISYLTNYRKMVISEVSAKGLEAFIAELEQGKLLEVSE